MRLLKRQMVPVVLSIIIIAGVLIGIIRVGLLVLENHPQDLEKIVGQVIGMPIQAQHIETHWQGLLPVISLRNVSLGSSLAIAQTNDAVLQQVDIAIDLLSSLARFQLQVAHLQLRLPQLTIRRNQDHSFSLAELELLNIPRHAAAHTGWEQVYQQDVVVDVMLQRLQFEDERRQYPSICLDDTHIVLRHHDDQLQANVQTSQCQTANPITLQVHLPIESLANRLVTGQAYLRLEKWDASTLQDMALIDISLPVQGTLDTEIWLSVVAGELHSVEGRLHMNDLYYPATSAMAQWQMALIQANFLWRTNQQGWQLQILNKAGNDQSTTNPIQLGYDQSRKQLHIKSTAIDVNQFLPVVLRQPQLRDQLPKAIAHLNMRGQLRDLNLQLTVGSMGNKYALNTRLHNLTFAAQGNWPGARGIQGQLVATSRGGVIQLNTKQAYLDWPGLFHNQLLLNVINGRVNWTRLDSGVLIESSKLQIDLRHLQTQNRLSVYIPDEGSPWLDMQTHFANGDAKYTTLYLPKTIMDEQLVEWLDTSIVDGYIESGDFVFHGRLNEFPYDQKQGTFAVRFKVKDGIFNYYKNWPLIRNLTAEVVFQGRSLSIQADAGDVYTDSRLEKVVVEVADLDADNPFIHINGAAQLNSQDLMRYWQETQLTAKQRLEFNRLRLTGSHQLDFQLSIPVNQGDLRFLADLAFQKNQLAISGLQLGIDDIQGQLIFDRHGVRSKAMQATFNGRPLTAQLGMQALKSGSTYRLLAQTQVDLSTFIRPVNQLLSDQLAGVTDIHLEIQRTQDKPAHLKLSSDLHGVAIKLPAPFAKPSETIQPVRLSTDLTGGLASPIHIELDKKMSSDWYLDRQYRIQSAYIYLGDQAGDGHRPAKGIELVGAIADINIKDWLDWWNQQTIPQTIPMDARSALSIKSDVLLNRVSVAQFIIPKVRLQWASEPFGWQASFSGGAKGIAQYQASSGQMLFDLSALSLLKKELTKDQDSDQEAIVDSQPQTRVYRDPVTYPAIDLSIEQLSYNNRELGKLLIQVEHQGDTLSLSKAVLSNPSTTISATGNWKNQDNQHLSQLDFDMDSKDFGKWLRSLGFLNSIKGGEGKISGTLSTYTPLFAANLGDWYGELSLDLRQGTVLEIQADAPGRIFGLLSFHTLPQRLLLDFSDVLGAGLDFNKITGHFFMQGGQMYTDDLLMENPNSKILVSGRIGLKEKDYDQLVRVMPNVGSTLPIAGALAGGPATAAALFLANKLFNNPLDKISEIEYSVVGPWSNPKIEKLVKDQPANDE